jgi:hypothetical protein
MRSALKNSPNAELLVNQALLTLVKQYGQASFGLLFDQFGDLELSASYAHRRFGRKLQYLCYTDQLMRHGMGLGKKAVYSLGPLAFKRQPGTTRAMPVTTAYGTVIHAASQPTGLAAQDPGQTSRALPRQYDVMRAPVLQAPPCCQVLRPGALDYQRYASHGARC